MLVLGKTGFWHLSAQPTMQQSKVQLTYLVPKAKHNTVRISFIRHTRMPKSQITDHDISRRASCLDRRTSRSTCFYRFSGNSWKRFSEHIMSGNLLWFCGDYLILI